MRLRFRGFTLIEVMIVMTIISILAAILIPNFKHARARAQLSTCLGNCKNLATALELYAIDSDGHFPDQAGLPGIDMVVAHGVLKRRPSCPATGACTFVDFQAALTPDRFSFSCVGNNHGECWPGLAAGYIPSYSNDLGPVLEP